MNDEANKALPPALEAKIEEKKDEKKDEKDEEAKKSASANVTEEQLKKSLDDLESIVKSSPEGRKQELFKKGLDGALSGDETAELQKLMAGEPTQASLGGGVEKALGGRSDEFQKAVNVAPFLDDLYSGLSTALKEVAGFVEKSDARTQERVVVLAKGLLDVGRVSAENNRLLKSVGETLGVIARQPARAPRSAVSVQQVVEKSFGGQQQKTELSKAAVLETLATMNEKSPTGLSKGGEDLTLAISKYEQFSDISPSLSAEVVAFHRANAG